MKVTVVFDFPSVTDVDSEEANAIVDDITLLTKNLSMFGNYCVSWVDDAQEESK